MSWEDRLQPAAYTSPTGSRHPFDYESVRRSVDKRTSAFEFREVDGAYVQDNGFGARKYALRCFFHGADHDVEASEFEAALLEPGVGRLEHPFYGTFDAIPFGSITRRDDLKSAANQSIIEVTFWSAIREVYPSLNSDPENEILTAIESFNAAAPQQYGAVIDLATVGAQASVKAAVKDLVAASLDSLGAAASATAEAQQAFDRAKDAIDLGLDVLIESPLDLAQAVIALIQSPSTAATDIAARLRGFEDYYASIVESVTGRPEEAPSINADVVNRFHSADLFVLGCVSGAALASQAEQYATRPSALASADTVLTLFDNAVAWRDEGFKTTSEIDPGTSYQAAHRMVAACARYLVSASFSLLPERKIVLDRPRTIVDLAAELYGDVDPYLDFLIDTNNLTGSEILELPAGRGIIYYV